ncbi:hypothetical protein DM860_008245 [Cuscuta australis]|uniref:Rubisco LSMT substrate-binding domain-containing protein n=1 Tax=Cuscuta australis TaxID=267555 RepID=A0A328D2Z5_9ASTE|nr:hypothetical protein DM860_008245 [Cuscuta australis]
MATLFPLYPASSSPSSSSPKHKLFFLKTRPYLHHHLRPVFLASAHPSEPSHELPEPVKTLWQWGSEEGVVSKKTPVRPGIVPEGLGLVATKDIGRNGVVLEVPRRFWISPDTVGNSAIGRVCSGLKPWVAVALFLLREKKMDDSVWRSYLDSLPDCTNSTVFCAGQKRSLLSFKVFIQYDLKKSNADFALDYGFIDSSPRRDSFTLNLEIPESDEFHGDKLDIAESNGLGETAYFDIKLGQRLPPQMLPYLRLVALAGPDVFLLESIFRNSIWAHLELPVSRANEQLICRVIRDACALTLSGYQTTLEEDEKMKEGNLNPRLEIAIGVRAGEKKVLRQIDNIFREREEELDELEYYQERRLKDLGLVGDPGEIIFWEPK